MWPSPPWGWPPLAAILTMVVALWVDRRWGEPPLAWHPVVWMGRYLAVLQPRLVAMRPPAALIAGALAWWVGALVVVAVAVGCEVALRLLLPFGAWWSVWLATSVTSGLLLKTLLAWRMLREEVAAVEIALADGLDLGRLRLSRLVSRDTRSLQAHEVREAALETLAENLNDSVVAPLFWFALAGLPGAALYRYANTADAMWGYRDHREWLGKWAARADDVLSWLPARLTALALQPAPARWGCLYRESRRTPSPNGGWPMGALALRLGRSLSKPGVYRLNEAEGAPVAADMPIAIHMCRSALKRVLAVLVLSLGLQFWTQAPAGVDDRSGSSVVVPSFRGALR